MCSKIPIILVVLALACVIGAAYPPPTNVPQSQNQDKVINTPFIYTRPTSVPSEERKLTKRHGVEQTIYTKSVNAYDGNEYSHHIPIYSTAFHDNPYVYQPAYNLPTPLVHAVSTPTLAKSISVPIYTTHSIPVTKTKTALVKNIKVIGPVYGKTKIATTYATHDPVLVSQPVKTAIAYSDAPVVSHMTFSGLGASYAW